MGACRHGQGGTWKCCKVFLCISNYIKTLSIRIIHEIHALFTQLVVGFWQPCPQSPTGPPELQPWTQLRNFHPQTPNLPTSEKNPADACE